MAGADLCRIDATVVAPVDRRSLDDRSGKTYRNGSLAKS
jgi:hypothetical protein